MGETRSSWRNKLVASPLDAETAEQPQRCPPLESMKKQPCALGVEKGRARRLAGQCRVNLAENKPPCFLTLFTGVRG